MHQLNWVFINIMIHHKFNITIYIVSTFIWHYCTNRNALFDISIYQPIVSVRAYEYECESQNVMLYQYCLANVIVQVSQYWIRITRYELPTVSYLNMFCVKNDSDYSYVGLYAHQKYETCTLVGMGNYTSDANWYHYFSIQFHCHNFTI